LAEGSRQFSSRQLAVGSLAVSREQSAVGSWQSAESSWAVSREQSAVGSWQRAVGQCH